MTPITYRVVNFLKRAEREDYFDRTTNFTPFSLQDRQSKSVGPAGIVVVGPGQRHLSRGSYGRGPGRAVAVRAEEADGVDLVARDRGSPPSRRQPTRTL